MKRLIAYIRRHPGGVTLDAAWFVLALAWAGFCIYASRYASASGPSVIPGLCAMSILVFTAFWMPIRNTQTLIRLADRRRREEMSLTFIDPRPYLWRRMRWSMLRLPMLVLPICISLTILSCTLTKIPQEKWFIPVFVFGLGSLAQLSSAALFLLLFRWFCRAPRDHWWSSAASIMVVLGTVIYMFTNMYVLEEIKRRVSIGWSIRDTTAVPIILTCEVLLAFLLVRLAWRRCWRKYFVFD